VLMKNKPIFISASHRSVPLSLLFSSSSSLLLLFSFAVNERREEKKKKKFYVIAGKTIRFYETFAKQKGIKADGVERETIRHHVLQIANFLRSHKTIIIK
jgi:hypothetical protein